jgi:hypothetical protein
VESQRTKIHRLALRFSIDLSNLKRQAYGFLSQNLKVLFAFAYHQYYTKVLDFRLAEFFFIKIFKIYRQLGILKSHILFVWNLHRHCFSLEA